MDDSGPWALLPWRTKSFSTPWERSSASDRGSTDSPPDQEVVILLCCFSHSVQAAQRVAGALGCVSPPAACPSPSMSLRLLPAPLLVSAHRSCPKVKKRKHDLNLSRLNTLPACAPVNASRAALRLSAHDSEPVRLARPSPYGSFIHTSTPVYPGALSSCSTAPLQ